MLAKRYTLTTTDHSETESPQSAPNNAIIGGAAAAVVIVLIGIIIVVVMVILVVKSHRASYKLNDNNKR